MYVYVYVYIYTIFARRYKLPVLQIRRSDGDGLGTVVHVFYGNVFCDPSLEPSHRDGSNEWSQHMFSLRSRRNCL